LSPPFNVYAEQMGLRVLAYVGDFLEFPQSGFTVSDATLKNRRDLIKRLLRGTLRGCNLRSRIARRRFASLRRITSCKNLLPTEFIVHYCRP
jgi:hypothetical protein